ncbi:MAG TPA: cytochrome c-type biogenesis protein CcmH [Nocardioidaceae bacterium]|nr:cytochrome c-type biogenesis protein CcmH [Nocardioidaceae bacterium]
MSPARRTLVAGVVVAVALLLAGSAVWLGGGDQTRPMSARVDDVADGLRCPTCNAVPVADSNSPIAQSMRAQIEEQLRAGRSPEQIRSWFVDRYGEQVLLLPGTDGFGLLLWVLPLGAVVVGVVAIAISWRGRRKAPDDGSGDGTRSALSTRRVAVAAVAFVAVGAAVPAALWQSSSGDAAAGAASATGDTGDTAAIDARDWVRVARSLEEQGDYDAASDAYREVLQRRPDDASVRTRLAFVLLRGERPGEALRVVEPVASAPGKPDGEALLVLGLAQRAESMPQADDTLRRFLSVAPEHPAAAQVRRLLKGQT